jgi:hypothetical protein
MTEPKTKKSCTDEENSRCSSPIASEKFEDDGAASHAVYCAEEVFALLRECGEDEPPFTPEEVKEVVDIPEDHPLRVQRASAIAALLGAVKVVQDDGDFAYLAESEPSPPAGEEEIFQRIKSLLSGVGAWGPVWAPVLAKRGVPEDSLFDD